VATARRAVLHEALEQIVANRAGVLAGQDTEYLHQLRVGTRRLRAALHVFGDLARKDDLRALRRMLRALARVTGPARDWDVFTRRLPATLRPAAERRRRSAYAALRRVLRAPQLWLLPRSLSLPACRCRHSRAGCWKARTGKPCAAARASSGRGPASATRCASACGACATPARS
jgi:hypothetical protein